MENTTLDVKLQCSVGLIVTQYYDPELLTEKFTIKSHCL